MISSCKGIVLRYFKSSQDSVVVKILTDVNGLVSFFVKNTSSKKKCKTPLSLLQPFSLINLSDIRFKKNNLAFLNEISLAKANLVSNRDINIKIKESCTLYKLDYNAINSIDDMKILDKILDNKGVNVVEINIDFNTTQKIEETINQKF